jgi:hypothetical protein
MEPSLKLELHVMPRTAWQGGIEIIPTLVSQGYAVLPGEQPGDILVLQGRDGVTRLLVSVGTPEKVNAEMLRRAAGAAAKWLQSHKVASAAVAAQALQELGIAGGMGRFVKACS